MKKILLGVLFIFCVSLFAFAQGIPAYEGEGADVAILVDIKANKGVKDNIVLVNIANPDGIKFEIYVYDKNNWKNFAGDSLKYLHDSSNVSANRGKDFGKYKYAAIVPQDGKKYNYELRVENSDLYFYVLPEDTSYSAFSSNAIEIDASKLKKKVKDNIRLVSNSKKIANTGFFIFADNGNGFQLVGAAYLKNKGDTCFAEGFNLDLKKEKYSRYALCPTDGEKYNFEARAVNSDLYIRIND